MRGVRAAGAFLWAAACVHGTAEMPARIVAPTAESRAELERAVSSVLGVAPVTLADNALTRTSTIVIERARRIGPDGHALDGRDLGRPERFRLVLGDGHCALIHERSGRRVPLESTTCAPAP